MRLFISDLHLSAGQAGTLRLFLQFLQGPAAEAEALYILGDLFDAWIGDDFQAEPVPQIQQAMKDLADSGCRIHLMHGNRDFLLGEAFARASGCSLLQDPGVIDLAGTPTLLMHGDLLCSDDLEYQQARRMLRDPAFIKAFLQRPVEERIELAREYRRRSGEAVSNKAADIMDVNQQTVEAQMRRWNTPRLIHGHTHRPARHSFQIDGRPAERIVLPEWRPEGGGYLQVTAEQLALIEYPAA